MRPSPKHTLLALALGLVLVACADATDGGSGSATDDGDEDEPAEADNAAQAERSQGPERREGFFWELDEEPPSTIDIDEIIRGGPPPDGIPPIDEPVYESVEEAAQWLEDDSPVMVVRGDQQTRVYPLAIMTWHEIANTSLDGEPVVVTYCPLCNSGLAFEAEIDGEVLDFGTSGRLWRSNLVMYDRQYGNLWTQFTGEAVVGERFLGQELERIATTLQGFGEVRETDPDAEVLSRDTGAQRDYGSNPYRGYDAEGNEPFLFEGESDGRFPAMTRVVGIPQGEGTAVLLEHLAEERVVELDAADQPVTLWWAPGQASALDASSIDEGEDVGQTVAFDPRVGDRTLSFEPVEQPDADAGEGEDGAARFRDEQTGSVWTLAGRAVEGELEGESLEALAIDDTFWFVWSVFKPDTEVIE